METYKIKTEVDTGNSIKDLEALRNELDELAQSGQQNTDHFKQLETELNNLSNSVTGTGQSLGQLDEVVKETDKNLEGLSMTTGQALGGSLQGLASGFEVAQGVMGAFGVESEAVEKAMLKVQSAMAISQGIKGVKEALPAFKSLGTTAINAFKGMTTAGKAFAATGIGLIITGIAVAMEAMSSAAEAAAIEVESLQTSVDALSNSFDFAMQQNSDYAREAVALAKLRGASEEELLKIELKATQQGIDERWKYANEMIKANNKILTNENSTAEQISKANDEIYKAQRAQIEMRREAQVLSAEFQLKEKELADRRLQEEKDRNKQYADERKSVLEKIRQAEQDYHDTFLAEQDLEILQVNRKFNELVKEAKKYKIDTTELENARLNEINEIKSKYAAEELKIEQEKQAEQDRIIKEANEQRLQDEEEFAEAYQQAINSDTQNEINAVNEKYFYLIQRAEQYGWDVAELEKKQAKELSEINDKYRADEKTKNEELQQAKYDAVQGGLQALLSLSEAFAGESEEQQKRAFQFAKAVNIAQATIDTYRSAVTAFKSAPNPILGAVFSAIAIASGIANIKKIASTTFEGGSTPSGQGGAGGLGGIITPEFNIVGNSPVNQLAELQGQPVQAYVVSGEVTTAQALDRNRIVNATL